MSSIKNITKNFSIGSLGLAGTTMGAISLFKEPNTSVAVKELTNKMLEKGVDIQCTKDVKQDTCQCTIKIK